MDIFEILPKDIVKKLPKDKVDSLINDSVKRHKEQNSRKSKLNTVLYIFTSLLVVWGIYILSFDPNLKALLLLILFLFMIYSGGKMIINGSGNMPYRDSSRFGPWKSKPLTGPVATIYGIISFIIGFLGYLIYFTPLIYIIAYLNLT